MTVHVSDTQASKQVSQVFRQVFLLVQAAADATQGCACNVSLYNDKSLAVRRAPMHFILLVLLLELERSALQHDTALHRAGRRGLGRSAGGGHHRVTTRSWHKWWWRWHVHAKAAARPSRGALFAAHSD